MSDVLVRNNETSPKTRLDYGGRSESILISILYLIGHHIPWLTFKTSNNSRGRPYVYSHTVIMRWCFIVRIWFRLDSSNSALHEFLKMDYPYNKKIMKACGGLAQVLDRRTFDRRLRSISTDIKERIVAAMANHFIHEGMIDPYIVVQ
jgi:hypothetical protein